MGVVNNIVIKKLLRNINYWSAVIHANFIIDASTTHMFNYANDLL